MKKGSFLFGLLLLAVFITACETAPTGDPLVVTVLVTQPAQEVEVVVTQFATVAVPVEVTREVFIEVTPEVEPVVRPELGSAENPISLIFSPSFDPSTAATRSEGVASALSEATGAIFTTQIPDTHQATVNAACEDPDSSIVFLTSLEYVLAQRQCNVQIGYTGSKNGLTWTAGMIVTRRDAEIASLQDLDGLNWGTANQNDLAAGLYFQALMQAEGITPATVSELETDSTTMISFADGENDFVTGQFLPPLLPFGDREWVYGEDDPEIWIPETGSSPFRSGIGFIVVIDYVDRGGYQVRDARANAFDVRSDIFLTTEILQLSEQIPNEAVAFGSGISLGVAKQVGDALEAFAASAECERSLCSDDFFGWDGVSPVESSFYDPIRFILDELELSPTDVFTLLSE